MKIGPKYKIARRLGASIFEKTQTPKFAASKERRNERGGKPKSSFGMQLNEKQKARLTYGITEKQFKNYVKKVLETSGGSQNDKLFAILEERLDNVAYRLGFASTRRQARQMVSHGHIKVNGKKITIPSYHVSKGDKITIRKESEGKGLFRNLEEGIKNISIPTWISFDIKSKEAVISGNPKAVPSELLFDIGAIFEYYRR